MLNRYVNKMCLQVVLFLYLRHIFWKFKISCVLLWPDQQLNGTTTPAIKVIFITSIRFSKPVNLSKRATARMGPGIR